MDRSTSNIPSFFNNRSVFITGGTGFLGKAVVEKILRTCHEVETVYVLIRPKMKSDVQARMQELFDCSLFDTIRLQNPNVFQKIVPINGDITKPYLGISVEDQQILTENVSIVIHSAATIKFDEKLKLSLNMNVQGTKRIVELSKRMSKLVALVHVSTAYANCDRSEIDEIIYPPSVDPDKFIQFVECMDDDVIEGITQKLIGSKPNTYTYTKALAGHVLTEEAKNLPICIVRPSIVTATWKDPVPGWIDNVNGPSGLMIACGKGVLRTIICDGNKVADFIPLDLAVNLILSAAWFIAENKPEGITVYNCCSGNLNPLKWGKFLKWVVKNMLNNPLSNVLWYPDLLCTGNKMWDTINDFFQQFVPAYVMDLFARLTGKKPVMLKIHKKLANAAQSFEYFTTNEWQFKTDNMIALHESLSPEDKQLFGLDVREVNWSKYMENYCLGLRKYVLNDNDNTLSVARKQLQKLYFIHKFTQLILIIMGVWGIVSSYYYLYNYLT